VGWLGLVSSKDYAWRHRYGKVNEHHAWVPRDPWLAPAEKTAIVDFAGEHPLEGDRRLTFRRLDRDVVAVRPSRVYRGLRKAGLLRR